MEAVLGTERNAAYIPGSGGALLGHKLSHVVLPSLQDGMLQDLASCLISDATPATVESSQAALSWSQSLLGTFVGY